LKDVATALGLAAPEDPIEAANATTYSVVAHLITYAATMRQAIQSYLRYHRLLTDRSAYRRTEQGSSATLVFEVSPGTRVCQRFHAELTLAGLFRMVQFFGGGAGVHSVSFEHEPPDHAVEYARLFHGLKRFDQRSSGVTFDSKLLDKTRVHADSELHAALEAQAQPASTGKPRTGTGSSSRAERLVADGSERSTRSRTRSVFRSAARSTERSSDGLA
jgi:hypothetical protein